MKKLLFITIASMLLTGGCFMESPTPLSPVESSYYEADLSDTWIMPHNLNVTVIIKAHDTNRLQVRFPDREDNQKYKLEYLVHTSVIDGKNYINAIQPGREFYEIYMYERPCPDLLLIYIPDPDIVENDITTGVVSGKIELNFGKSRILEEEREGLIDYLRQKQKNLFIPFRYMVRKTKADNLSSKCKAAIKPLPVDSGRMLGR